MITIDEQKKKKVSDTDFIFPTITKHEESQNSSIQGLYSSVSELKAQITQLESSLASTKTELQGNISSSGTTERNAMTEAVSEVDDKLDDLIGELNSFYNFASIKSSSAELTNLTSTKASVSEVDAEKIVTDAFESVDVNTTYVDADIVKVNQKLEAVKAVIDELEMDVINCSKVVASLEVQAAAIKADTADVSRLNGEKITVADSGSWKEPVGTPDNTELLMIKFPMYKGTLHIVSQTGNLELTILDGTLVSFRQNTTVLYRIEFADSYVTVYLTDAINYKELFIGDKTNLESTSELVDRTLIESNINTLSGMISERKMISMESSLSVVYVDELPETGVTNTIYVVAGNTTYYCNGTNFIPFTTKVSDFKITNNLTLQKESFIWNEETTTVADDIIDLTFVEV